MATTASCLQVAGTVVIPSNDVINIGCFYLTAGEAELADPTVPFEDGCSDTGPVTRQPILAVAGLPCHVTPIGREWTGVSTPDHQGVSWVDTPNKKGDATQASPVRKKEIVWGTISPRRTYHPGRSLLRLPMQPPGRSVVSRSLRSLLTPSLI